MLQHTLIHVQVPKYMNYSTWRSNSLPTRSRQSTLFWLRTTSSDLEVLTLIPAALHSATNHPSNHWRSQPDEAFRTTSSTKSRDAMLTPLNWISFAPQLCLEIPFMNITNSITLAILGQPYWNTALTGKNLTYCWGREHSFHTSCIAHISDSRISFFFPWVNRVGHTEVLVAFNFFVWLSKIFV